jgi:thioredoxin-related protein
MKTLSTILIALFLMNAVEAQDNAPHLYDPTASAEKDISEAVHKAKAEGKHVMIQAGGNWCGWCIRFDRFCKDDPRIDSSLRSAYVIVHLNFSKENYNLPVFEKMGFPQRFGFPVFIILDGQGKQLHVQNSSYLEKEKSYDRDKVLGFLEDWSPLAFDPSRYKMNRP